MMLLCELLPHPLPLVTSAEIGSQVVMVIKRDRTPLNKGYSNGFVFLLNLITTGPEEQTLLLHYRETWSAHLLPFWEKILSHVESLLPSCNNHVHQVSHVHVI